MQNVIQNYSVNNDFEIINAWFFFYMTRQVTPQDASIVNKVIYCQNLSL